MIQLTSSIDGDEWDSSAFPFYLEIYGETQPKVNLSFAEVLGPGPVSTDAASGIPALTTAEPVYEYWWTIGFHRGDSPEAKHWRDRLFHRGGSDQIPRETETISFEDPAAWSGSISRRM